MSINPVMILAATINFFIFYFILRKFVFNKTLAVMNSRKEEVENSFRMAREQEERAKLLKEQYEDDVIKYRNDGLKLVETFKEKADKVYAEIVEESHKEASTIKEKAKKDISRERAKASQEIKQEIIDLSMKLAEKTLKSEINESKHKSLIDEFITKVGI
ncbi:MAG: F0F1 ATP synthase subunit B [Clostridium sp.]|uniref:F0F1 ATP synthase subunit B n=1 Tax=Clostridium sp. TaxID=1506 RepID=UPI00305CC1C7